MSGDLTRHDFSDHASDSELDYRNRVQPQEAEHADRESWFERLGDGRRDVVAALRTVAPMEGQVLDLGAGSCWFSAELSRWPEIERIFALDFSERLLQDVAPHVIAHLAGDETKITRVVGDFHRLEFPDDSLDHVVFDAAVHHVPVDSFSVVFDEIGRVLKPGGSMVAIREPVLPVLPGLKQFKRNAFGRHERQFGVTENSFTRGEWAALFAGAGFELQLRRLPRAAPGGGWRGRVKRTLSAPGLGFLRELVWPGEFVFVAVPAGT